MPLLPFVTGSNKGKSFQVSSEQCVNYYVEVDENGKNVVVLHETPGLELFGDYGAFPCRGFRVVGTMLYAVFRANFVVIDLNGVGTTKGSLNTISGFVELSDNGNEVMVVDGQDGWIYDIAGDTFTQISDTDFTALNSSNVTFDSGYFIVNSDSGDAFNISALEDGTSWDGLDFDSANQQPDDLIRPFQDHGEVWMFGAASIEVWSNNRNADFPYGRLGNTHITWGLAAKWSLVQFDDSLAFLGRRQGDGALQAIRINGFQPQRISTDSVETQWQSYSQVGDATAFSYSREGHVFYVITFPSAGKTWAYDARTNLWAERSSGLSRGRHRAQLHTVFGTDNIVSDFENGKLYKLKEDVYTDNGDLIRGVLVGKHIHDSNLRLKHSSLEILFQSGVGLVSGYGKDPQAMMRFSDDGGASWSSELKRPLGKMGEFLARALWRGLGASRDRVYEIVITAPVKRTVIGMILRVKRSARAHG